MAIRKFKAALIISISIPLVIVVTLAFMSRAASKPDNLGIHEGRLASCPNSPNAVSSVATDSYHQMKPLPLTVSASEAISRLEQIVSMFPRGKVISVTPNYMHVEFTSAIFRFVDDVEFYCSQTEHLIHFRSASRVGHSDFGVNRKRMETIIEAYTKKQ